jgi:aminotransferase
VVCTPGNSSGKVFSKEDLRAVAEFAIDHDLFIFTDEIYEYFIFADIPHISPGSLREIADRTITISGYSKTFSIAGWRIGYSACQKRWADMIGYINGLVYVCAPAPLQIGVTNGIKLLNSTYYTQLRDSFKQKRDQICLVLNEAGIIPAVPKGAYYVLADASILPGSASKDKAMYLLLKAGVSSVPGKAFFHGSDGENILRFCFAKTDEVLEEACNRLTRLKL